MVHPVQEVLESLYAAGRCPRLHINALSAGVVLPSFVRDQWKERLVIDLDPSYPLELEYGDDAVQANLSFAGSVTRCVFPWRAIYIVADRATGRGIKIEQNIPASLRAGSTSSGGASGEAGSLPGADASRDARAARTTIAASTTGRRSFREGLSVVPDPEHDAEGDEDGDSTDKAEQSREQGQREPLRATVELPTKEEALGSGRARSRAQRDKAVREKEARAAAAALGPQEPVDAEESGNPGPQEHHDLDDKVSEAGGTSAQDSNSTPQGSDAAPRVSSSSDPALSDLPAGVGSEAKTAKTGEPEAAESGEAPRRSKSRKRSAKDSADSGADEASDGIARADEDSSDRPATDAAQSNAARRADAAEKSPAAMEAHAAATNSGKRTESSKRASPSESSAEADLRAKQRRAAFRVISGGNGGDNG